jgi:hypothetical protein
VATARFHAGHVLTQAPPRGHAILEGADSVTALPMEAF